jgi:hypothetical protein
MDKKPPQGLDDSRYKAIALWSATLGLFCICIVYLYMLLFEAYRDELASNLLKDHYAALVGLPAAASVSFILVVLLRQADGPIEFEGLGFKFRGASGQVAMWVVCFLAFAIAIKLCWQL